ncbi:MAG: FG-GAP-like repeat-containing protein [Microcoleaceae cyanobacterium]
MNNQENLLQISQTPESPLAEVDFINRGNFDVGNGATSFAVGEFNGDGISDLAVTNRISDNVSILLGNGDGTLSNAINFNVGESPGSVAVGEFNRDGISDLAVANFSSDSLSVLLGNGDGTFSNAINFEVTDVEGRPSSVVVGEFNGDGILDLVVSTIEIRTVFDGPCCEPPDLCCDTPPPPEFKTTISLFLGNGDGNFSNGINLLVRDWDSFSSSFEVGEFNGDSISDLAVTNSSSDNLSVLLGNGDGSFGNTTNFSVENSISVAVGEFNRDGISDLVVASPTFDDHKVSVLLGNGNGSFSNPINFNVDESPRSVIVGEFNGDGISDLVVEANYSRSDNVLVLLGNGDGSFSNPTNFDAGEFTTSVAVGEFNGDGISDLALLDTTEDNISILLNATPVAARGAIVIQGEALGSENNDLVSGSEIDDTFFALAGDDLVSARAGNDEINGNRGNDIISGGTGDDNLYGGRNLDYILGDAGNDLIFGERDSDTLKGGEGADTIYGGKQNDELEGGEGNDLISGDIGDDILSGGRGSDFITGGKGSDTFIFNDSRFERDEITDFASIQGDLIILDRRTFSAIDSEPGNGFSIASEFATVTNDELAETVNAIIVYNSENGNLFYNRNGSEPGFDNQNIDSENQFLTLTNTPLLTAGDFFIRLN